MAAVVVVAAAVVVARAPASPRPELDPQRRLLSFHTEIKGNTRLDHVNNVDI